MNCLVPALHAPPHFNLDATVRSSWLAGLAPLSYDPARPHVGLRLCLALPAGPAGRGEGRAADLCLVQEGGAGAPVRLLGEGVDPAEVPAILPRISAMLRLDEDLSLFYRMTDRDPDLSWVRTAGQGRILRAPTAAEDLIKGLLCGTGSAALAHTLSARLCALLGPTAPSGQRAFPRLADLAAQPLSFYQHELRAGRLARPLHELIGCCHEVLYAEAIRRPPLPPPPPEVPICWLPGSAHRDHLEQEREWAERLEALVHSLPGIGMRATALLLPLCGCYNAVSVSLSLRVAWRRRYPRRGQGLSERELNRQIADRVRGFQPYRGLALWLLLFGSAEKAADRPIQIAA